MLSLSQVSCISRKGKEECEGIDTLSSWLSSGDCFVSGGQICIVKRRNVGTQTLDKIETVDLGRRRFLTAATTVVGAVGAAYVAVPFLGSWSPSKRALAAGAPVEADVSKL